MTNPKYTKVEKQYLSELLTLLKSLETFYRNFAKLIYRIDLYFITDAEKKNIQKEIIIFLIKRISEEFYGDVQVDFYPQIDKDLKGRELKILFSFEKILDDEMRNFKLIMSVFQKMLLLKTLDLTKEMRARKLLSWYAIRNYNKHYNLFKLGLSHGKIY